MVLEAIKQDVDVGPQHQATGTPAIKESEETATKVPTDKNLADLIFQTLPPSRISKPSGEPTDSKRRQGRKSSSSSRSVSEKEIDSLCQLFPQMCRSELATHLRATAGDVNSAADRILAGEPVSQKSMSPPLDDNRSDVDLPRMTPEERLATMERYGMVDASSSQTVHRPKLPTAAEVGLLFLLFCHTYLVLCFLSVVYYVNLCKYAGSGEQFRRRRRDHWSKSFIFLTFRILLELRKFPSENSEVQFGEYTCTFDKFSSGILKHR
ncbi:unnamed protein product [Dibothriocephalus latus]|uniref:CUE domain-containing protein n=1 Tax=Dibothriocephalus latus TaxID=60516 RepID=A0A3P7P4V3_DIBLA|nr:unnamed protein product [Dibothriocephalus latus]